MGDIKCDVCGHSIKLHNRWNCTYAFEKENECHCSLNHDVVEARYYAKKYRKEKNEQEKLLNYFMAWFYANQND